MTCDCTSDRKCTEHVLQYFEELLLAVPAPNAGPPAPNAGPPTPNAGPPTQNAGPPPPKILTNHVSESDPQGVNGGNKSREKSMTSLAGSDKNDQIHLSADELCRINVCGQLFITTFRCLEEYPRTLLGSPLEREKYYCPELNAYFFNRNRSCFESVLLFYQTGDYFPPLNTEPGLWEAEVAFFRISSPKDYVLPIELEGSDEEGSSTPLSCALLSRKKKAVNNFLKNPRSSPVATVWHTVDILFICVSIVFLILETDPNLSVHFTDKTDAYYNSIYGVNAFVISFFTIDLVLRLLTWPNFFSFWKNIFNILDILSILPFYVGVIADLSGGPDDSALVVLRVCRIFRIIRIFKFVRHSQDLILIVKVVIHAKKELGLLVILLGIFTITFGAIMYYVEHDVNPLFYSIMQGCWWAIVTITTVGYGEVVPITPGGKFVGSIVLTLGIVFLALPMTIIVSKFSSVYEKEKEGREA